MTLEKRDISYDYGRWLKAYLRNLKHREISKNTLLIYNRILLALENFIKEEGDLKSIKEIDQEVFLSFFEDLEEKSKEGTFSRKTKTLYLSVLKSFFTYISDNNDEFYTYEKEFKGLIPKNANKSKKISYLSDTEVDRLLIYLNENLNRHYHYIHSLGIKLMLFSGLRVSEALNLKLEDIYISDIRDSEDRQDFYELHLKNTKSNEEQTALIKIEYIEKEINYFKSIRGDREYIFTGKSNQKLINRSNFYVSVSNIMEKLQIRGRGLHIFRHTCAMQLFRKTGNLLVLKETLRHSDIKTTMIYAHAEKKDIAEAMRNR